MSNAQLIAVCIGYVVATVIGFLYGVRAGRKSRSGRSTEPALLALDDWAEEDHKARLAEAHLRVAP